ADGVVEYVFAAVVLLRLTEEDRQEGLQVRYVLRLECGSWPAFHVKVPTVVRQKNARREAVPLRAGLGSVAVVVVVGAGETLLEILDVTQDPEARAEVLLAAGLGHGLPTRDLDAGDVAFLVLGVFVVGIPQRPQRLHQERRRRPEQTGRYLLDVDVVEGRR